VDHVVDIPLSHEGRSPRRLALYVLGAGGLAVLMVGMAVLLTKRHSSANTRASAQPALHLARSQVGPTSPAGKPTITRRQTSVLILNGNGISGAAGAASSVLHAKAYPVRGVGNAPRMDYPQSLVMYRPGFRPEAMRFGRDLGIKLVGPLDGMRVGAMHGAKLVYVLGT
jgi:LytR cell envelope-related transcriptional attenuator